MKSIPTKADKLTSDHLGNAYVWNENFMWMYSNKGDSLAAFNSRKYGSISHVDATNPYEILVFFADYNVILFLDNYLSDNGEIVDLQKMGYDQITHACKSRANGIWIYDAIQQRAIHLNNDFKADKQTINLSQWFDGRVMPNSMMEYNNQLFISSEDGIYIFDHFGTYRKKIPIHGIHSFQVIENEILYRRTEPKNQTCSYHLISFKENCDSFSNLDLLNLRIEKNRLFGLSNKNLLLFSTN
ncbi:MAG: hypothetical protein JKY48_18255 [Flavobacteriales bacterium]|nr:hypothetical protein [Flavobacteriales bacterium]